MVCDVEDVDDGVTVTKSQPEPRSIPSQHPPPPPGTTPPTPLLSAPELAWEKEAESLTSRTVRLRGADKQRPNRAQQVNVKKRERTPLRSAFQGHTKGRPTSFTTETGSLDTTSVPRSNPIPNPLFLSLPTPTHHRQNRGPSPNRQQHVVTRSILGDSAGSWRPKTCGPR
ncbi:unnamed protein product, partial [Pleuronectes platessa]